MMGSQGGFASFGGGMGNQAPGAGQSMFISNNGGMMLGAGNPAGQGQQGGMGVGLNPNNGQGPNGVQSHETGTSFSAAEYSLPGILHYLQSEWRRYEKDRNEWEIERAEMRARIALLEGERRGVENLKTDLMRRVKMLEYALRQERSKYLSTSTSGLPGAPAGIAKNPLLQGLEKSASGSGRSSPSRNEDMPPGANASNDPGAAHHARSGTNMSNMSFNPSTIGTMGASTLNGSTLFATGSVNLGGAGAQLSRASSSAKDPRSRAKSRDYLKQCLQEISYLTSASTLNPLPDRGVASTSSVTGGSVQGPPRPRKTMLENVPAPAGLPAQPAEHQPGPGPGPGPHGGSLRRGPGSNTLSLPGKSMRPTGRSPLFASEPVMEETAEAEEEAAERDQPAPESRNVSDPLGVNFKGQHAGPDSQAEEHESHAPPSEAQPLTNGDDAENHNDGPTHTRKGARSTPFAQSSGNSDSSDSSDSFRSTGSTAFSDESMTDQEVDESDQVTAIFKPGGKDWEKLKEAGLRNREKREQERKQQTEDDAAAISDAQAQLALTSERVNQLMNRSGRPVAPKAGSDRSEEDDLANLSLSADDEDGEKAAADAAADSQMWKSKKVLRNHLDAVRAVAFDHSELCLVSGSDDNTIKFWKLDASTFNQPSAKTGTESDPLVTLRGHSAPVTCLAVSSNQRRIYSGSMDSSVRVWLLPDRRLESYPPFDKSMELGCLVGHTQAVWDLALLPDRSDEEGLLATASADGTVKIWAVQKDVAGGKAPAELRLSWGYYGTEVSAESEKERENLEKTGGLPVPTSVDACHSDLRLCAVAYSNSVVKLFEVETGRQVRQLKSDSTYDGTQGTQINKVVTHPTLPLAITAHEDMYIRMFDLETGECTLSMAAHLDAVTSLDIDPAGLTLVSGGHDCSVRFWDIAGGSLVPREEGASASNKATDSSNEGQASNANTAVCRQEISSHRKKGHEGVLAVKYHPTAPLFASAGADSVIRIYG